MALFGVALLLVGWIALSATLSALPGNLRVDLTEGSLYTLSPGVRAMLTALDEPVKIDFYYSQESAKDISVIRNHALRVQEFLDELARVSGGRVEVETIDPQPFSEGEDAAKAAGIAPITADGAGRQLMLGLVVSGTTDRREGIPYLNPEDEAYLEYDIARAIVSVSRQTRARVALITSMPMDSSFDPRAQQMTPPWQVLAQLRTLFDVEVVAATAEKLPEKFDALVIAHPKGLGEPLLKAIDAYAVSGGKLLLFLDPYCESDAQAAGPGGFGAGGGASDLGPLPKAWGIEWGPGRIVADRSYAQRVRARSEGGLATIDYVAWLKLPKAAISQNDPAFGVLQTLVMLSVGSLGKSAGSALEFTPLVESSADSMVIDGTKLGAFADPAALLREFKSDNVKHVIGGRFVGSVSSAYPTLDAAAVKSAAATIIVIADADLLRNETWIQEERLGSLSLGWRAFADNGSLLVNCVEQLCGNDALLSLRSRSGSQRSFDVVLKIQREAEDRFRAREEELKARIAATQNRVNELQKQKSPDQLLVLTGEQQAQLQSAQEEVMAARKELRQVQFSLREEVEALGHHLMLLNVVVWPIGVAVMAVGFGLRRSLWKRKGAV